MRALKDREKQILKLIVEEHIRTAQPVSSFDLLKKYNLDVCSATIRNDMFSLTKRKYLYKPYTSSGRIPTTKGYRLYVEEIIKENNIQKPRIRSKIKFKKGRNLQKTLIEFTREIATFTRNLILSYFSKNRLLFEEGWKKVLLEPEFEDNDYRRNFLKTVDYLESEIEDISRKVSRELEIFIGNENPISKTDDFTLIFCKSQVDDQKIFLAMIGPKRMHYHKSIATMKELLRSLNKT